MELGPRIDFTPERWFSTHRSSRKGNLLLDIIPGFDYLSAFGLNTLERTATYIGLHNYLDKFTGYEMTWDGRHVCDRCGGLLDESGAAKSVRLAYALGELEFAKKRIGLCDRCEEDMNQLYVQDDNEFNKAYWNNKYQMPNDWGKYAWL